MAKSLTRKEFYLTLGSIALVIMIVLIVAAGLLQKAKGFATSQVKSQLIQEKITFPPADSKSLSKEEFPSLQQYGGQTVDTGPKAKAYANEFIWAHMMSASGGKTYAEVSAAAQAAPTDAKLAALKNVLFQGDMLRSSLLTAYAFSVFGMIAGIAAPLALAAGLLVGLIGLYWFTQSKR
jgi:hypothetical protein